MKHQVRTASYRIGSTRAVEVHLHDDGQTLTLTDDKCPPGMTAMLVWSRVTTRELTSRQAWVCY